MQWYEIPMVKAKNILQTTGNQPITNKSKINFFLVFFRVEPYRSALVD